MNPPGNVRRFGPAASRAALVHDWLNQLILIDIQYILVKTCRFHRYKRQLTALIVHVILSFPSFIERTSPTIAARGANNPEVSSFLTAGPSR
jgi:hypothetical protein